MQPFDNSLVCEHGKWVLWWHARSGCTSLKVWYLEQFGIVPDRESCGPDWPRWRWDGMSVHHRAAAWTNRFEPDRHRGFFHFTVIRHPLARFASHYDQQLEAGETRSLEQYLFDTVRMPIENADPHVISQAHGLWGLTMHCMLQLDKVNEHWQELMEMIRAPREPLSVLNYRGAGDKWEATFENSTLRMIATRHYAEDLALYKSAQWP